jgi:hypothetical protein
MEEVTTIAQVVTEGFGARSTGLTPLRRSPSGFAEHHLRMRACLKVGPAATGARAGREHIRCGREAAPLARGAAAGPQSPILGWYKPGGMFFACQRTGPVMVRIGFERNDGLEERVFPIAFLGLMDGLETKKVKKCSTFMSYQEK